MTDELSIQQQPRQNGNYAVAGTVLGAGLGAAGGAATSYWTNLGYKSKADYDKVIAMKEDSFKREIERGGDNKGNWEKLQELTKKVQDAESEYDKKIDEVIANSKSATGQLPDDNAAKKALDVAQKNYDSELAKKTAERTVGVGSGAAEIVKFDPEWKMGATAANEYKALYCDWETAKNALAHDANYSDVKTQLTSRRTAIEKAYNEIIADAEKTIDPKGGKKAIKTLEQYLQDSKGQDAIEKILEKNDIVKLNNQELVTLAGGESAILDSSPTAKRHFTVFEVTKKDGTKGYVQIQTEKGGAFKKRPPYEKLLEKKQEQALEEYSANLKQYIDSQKKLSRLAETIKLDKSLVKVAGLERNADGSIKDIADKLEEFLTESKTYADEMKVIDEAGLKDFANKKGVTIADTNVKNLMTKYSADSPKELYNMLGARLGIARQYKGEKEALSTVIKDIIEKDEILSNLSKEKSKIESGFKVNVSYSSKQQSISSIESRIRNQFGEFLKQEKTGSKTISGMTEEEARKALEGTRYAEALEKAKKAAEEEAKKLGLEGKELSREDAIKKFGQTKEDFTKSVKGEVKTEIEKLCEKVKIRNPLVTTLIGAGALALVGLGIGAASKKSAPEEEIA